MTMRLALLLVYGVICGVCLTAQAAPATQPIVHEVARLDECGGGAVWSRDGSKLVTLNGSNLITGTQLQAQVWDARTYKPLGAPLDHGLPLSRVEFDASSTKVLTVGYDDGTHHDKVVAGQARLWDASTGRLLLSVIHGKLPLTDAALSPDGELIATCARNDPTVRLIDAKTGNLKATLVHPENVRCVRFDPAGGTLLTCASAGGAVRLWDVASGQIRAQVEGTDEPLDASNPLITSDGKRLVLPGFYHVGIFQMATGRTLAMVDLQTHLDESLIGFSVSADGSRIATTTFGIPTGGVWDVATGRRLFSFDDCFDRPVLSPDGWLVLIERRKERDLCDVASGAVIKLEGELDLSNAKFSPDSQRIAIPRFDRTTAIYAVTW